VKTLPRVRVDEARDEDSFRRLHRSTNGALLKRVAHGLRDRRVRCGKLGESAGHSPLGADQGQRPGRADRRGVEDSFAGVFENNHDVERFWRARREVFPYGRGWRSISTADAQRLDAGIGPRAAACEGFRETRAQLTVFRLDPRAHGRF